jgi:translation initiation factor IF-1
MSEPHEEARTQGPSRDEEAQTRAPHKSQQASTASGDTEREGVVIEALPNTLFKVKLDDDQEVLTYLAGKMRLHRIRVLVGDRVLIKLDEYGGKGRIIRRY